jgi:hypothetical protein
MTIMNEDYSALMWASAFLIFTALMVTMPAAVFFIIFLFAFHASLESVFVD